MVGFLGKFVYILATLTCFTLFTSFYVWLRNQPNGGNSNGSNQATYGYLKVFGIRAAAFLVFAVFGYLLLAEPFRQMSDGRVLIDGKGADHVHICFADTESGSFWFALFLNASFGLLSIFFGAIFLIVNPKSKFWKRKPQPINK